ETPRSWYFDGAVDMETAEGRKALEWMGLELSVVNPSFPGAIKGSANLFISPEFLRLAESNLQIDKNHYKGTIIYHYPVSAEARPLLEVAIVGDEWNIDEYITPITWNVERDITKDGRYPRWLLDAPFDIKARMRIGFGTWRGMKLKDFRVQCHHTLGK